MWAKIFCFILVEAKTDTFKNALVSGADPMDNSKTDKYYLNNLWPSLMFTDLESDGSNVKNPGPGCSKAG